MAQPEFTNPDFISGSSADEIHERMMANLPGDIDDMPGGFPYDFTMPAALEKSELINYHLVRAIMIAFPEYSWDEWLDLHGKQAHIERHEEGYATGYIEITGTVGAEISAGTVFCVPSKDSEPAIEYSTTEDGVIGEDGTAKINIIAAESGTGSNVSANSISIMAVADKNVTSVNNPEPVIGGTERESDDDFFDRISAEYDNNFTYLGNDSDYIRWAKDAGAGDCIVVPTADGPGTVKLVLVDGNGQPANQALIKAVYDYIVSDGDRKARLLPTACAKLTCVAATTVPITYTCTGLIFDETTSIEQIKEDFKAAVKTVYEEAKDESILRYNDIRPLISAIAGVEDFDTFLMNGGTSNISLAKEEYPETGTLNFSE